MSQVYVWTSSMPAFATPLACQVPSRRLEIAARRGGWRGRRSPRSKELLAPGELGLRVVDVTSDAARACRARHRVTKSRLGHYGTAQHEAQTQNQRKSHALTSPLHKDVYKQNANSFGNISGSAHVRHQPSRQIANPPYEQVNNLLHTSPTTGSPSVLRAKSPTPGEAVRRLRRPSRRWRPSKPR